MATFTDNLTGYEQPAGVEFAAPTHPHTAETDPASNVVPLFERDPQHVQEETAAAMDLAQQRGSDVFQVPQQGESPAPVPETIELAYTDPTAQEEVKNAGLSVTAVRNFELNEARAA